MPFSKISDSAFKAVCLGHTFMHSFNWYVQMSGAMDGGKKETSRGACW